MNRSAEHCSAWAFSSNRAEQCSALRPGTWERRHLASAFPDGRNRPARRRRSRRRRKREPERQSREHELSTINSLLTPGCAWVAPRCGQGMGNSFPCPAAPCWHRTFVLSLFSDALRYRRACRKDIRLRSVSWCPCLSHYWTERWCIRPWRRLRRKDPCRKRACSWRILVGLSRRSQCYNPTCPPVWPLCPTLGHTRPPEYAPGPDV